MNQTFNVTQTTAGFAPATEIGEFRESGFMKETKSSNIKLGIKKL